MKIENVLYRATSKATGGRDGSAAPSDGSINVRLPQDVTIVGHVGIGPIQKGFGIEAELEISMPGIERGIAEGLFEKAHQVCSYSNATRGNINVTLKLI